MAPILISFWRRLVRDHGDNHAERKKLASLEAGKAKAHASMMEPESRQRDAESALKDARNRESSQLAYAFSNGGDLRDDPVASAQAAVNSAQAEAAKFERIEKAINGEIDKLNRNLHTATHNVYAAMSSLVCASDEYQLLVQQHREAWLRLSSVKTALVTVTRGLHAYMPQNIADEAYRSEPMEERVGYPVDPVLVGAWASSLAQLENDAETELPLFG